MGLEGSGACGAVGIGTGVVLSGIPVGACACGAEGRIASIGPPALGAKGCEERLQPTGERLTMICASLALLHPLLSLTHWIFRSLMLPYKSSSHSANHVRCASLTLKGQLPWWALLDLWKAPSYEKTFTTALRASEMHSPFGALRHHLPPASGGTMGT